MTYIPGAWLIFRAPAPGFENYTAQQTVSGANSKSYLVYDDGVRSTAAVG